MLLGDGLVVVDGLELWAGCVGVLLLFGVEVLRLPLLGQPELLSMQLLSSVLLVGLVIIWIGLLRLCWITSALTPAQNMSARTA